MLIVDKADQLLSVSRDDQFGLVQGRLLFGMPIIDKKPRS